MAADALGSGLRRLVDEYSYGPVLALLVVLNSWALVAPEGVWSRFAIVVLQALTLLVAAWAGRARPPIVRVAWLLAALACAGGLAGALGSETAEDAGLVAAVGVVLLTPLVMVGGLARALRHRGVTPQVILGAVAIYLLLATFCAGVYGAVARLGEGPLFSGGRGDATTAERYYFSFVTQATVGYGDYTVARPGARAVAVWQAVAGQLYLVTIVALLVGRLGGRPAAVGRRTPSP